VRHGVVILVRQAHAGCKGKWNGDDALRPLTERGVIQAASLVRSLSDDGVSVVWSPSVRCRQTLLAWLLENSAAPWVLCLRRPILSTQDQLK